MPYLTRLPVAYFLGSNYPSAESVDYSLVSKTDAEGRSIPADSLKDLRAYSEAFWITWVSRSR